MHNEKDFWVRPVDAITLINFKASNSTTHHITHFSNYFCSLHFLDQFGVWKSGVMTVFFRQSQTNSEIYLYFM
jgi:hypothetical protein